jgi:DeoR-like helix-turn-helix domain
MLSPWLFGDPGTYPKEWSGLTTDLAQKFQTSEDTIRRALRDLAAQESRNY